MLNAILHGKKRGTGTEGETLADSFTGAEDTVTATLFERLFYLADDLLTRILFAPEIWGDDVSLPACGGVETRFWPRWPLTPPTGKEPITVEPDVVIEFPDRLLVIEAKRFDSAAMQAPDQLAREWMAARQNKPGKPIWLLAVAGLSDSRAATVDHCRQDILVEIKTLGGAGAEEDFRFAGTGWQGMFLVAESVIGALPQYHRLLHDIREGLVLHGIRVERPVWLADLACAPWTGVRPIATSPQAFPPMPSTLPSLTAFGSITTPPTFFLPGDTP